MRGLYDFALNSPVVSLYQVISKVFPGRSALLNAEFEGTLAQAWETYSRQLGVSLTELARAVAPQFDVPVADQLDQTSHEDLARLSASFCQEHNVLPLRLEDGCLLVATANPFDFNVQERASFLAQLPIRWLLAPPQDIEDAVVFAYARDATRHATVLQGTAEEQEAGSSDNAIVRLGRMLLLESVKQRASDLHIQPFLGAFVVRIRVDGVLRRLMMLEDSVASSLVRHLKSRSNMDVTDSRVPQDGRMSMVIDGREFDMRVSSLPASRGERLVIRFLEQGRVQRLSGAGFSHADLQMLRRGFIRPSGLVIMTGPTGCGKTSTLYGMLTELNRSSVNIITVENPVEYRIPGISQVEVDDKVGRTFLSALRSILRQDPDIVLIGEIRDRETAEIATQAALTGHLVLSTLHTNDAMTAIPRLLNLGIQPSILADSLAMVVAQRLCRRLCPHCKAPVVEPLSQEERSFLEATHNRPGCRAVGCKVCRYTGYLGRLPVVEIVEMSKRLRDGVAMGEARLAELNQLREGGLRLLAASGSVRIISGDTTVSEVMSVVGPAFWGELAEHYGTVCFADSLALEPRQLKAGQGVLLVTPQPGLSVQVETALADEGIYVVTAGSAEQAHHLLEQDEDIAFIVFDLAEQVTLEQAVSQLSLNRLHTSWARLPALVLLPAHLVAAESELRESGVLAAMMKKPLDSAALLAHLRRIQAR
ncbi:MAG: GspE/PulE family protein [Pseudomonadaceae bacterium]